MLTPVLLTLLDVISPSFLVCALSDRGSVKMTEESRLNSKKKEKGKTPILV